MALKRAIAQSLLTAAALLAAPHAFADDAPVEKPAVEKPALPQTGPAGAESPAHASSPSDAPHQAKPAGSTHAAASTQPHHAETTARAQAGGGYQRLFLYLAPGLGVFSGLSGGQDFERTNPALTGLVGVEIPLGGATGLGFELDGDLELAGQADRGMYSALLLRARLGQMLTRRNRLWGALGIGGAGYQSASFAVAVAAGTSLMLVPKFGLDFSANLNLLGSASSVDNAGNRNDYGGGAVLLIAIRALFEFHR